jgi:hypothetical protein
MPDRVDFVNRASEILSYLPVQISLCIDNHSHIMIFAPASFFQNRHAERAAKACLPARLALSTGRQAWCRIVA